jgi:hypothetical protein
MRTEGSTNLNPELVEFVRSRALMLPTIPRETLATALKYEIEAEERVDWRVPSHENLMKMISSARNHHSALDEPWSLSCLARKEYHIPPEALPTVVSFYKQRLTENDVLTIREALWAARLFKIVDPPDLVFDWAFLYAIDEMIAEESGKPFESRERDLEMINNPQIAREVMREIAIWDIAYKYGTDPVRLKELNLSIEETEEIAKSGKYKKGAQNERKHKAKKQK